MGKIDLQSIEVACPNDTCGDPVPSYGSNQPSYTKRRMHYAGEGFIAHAVYKCPVCGKKRKFSHNLFTNGYHET